MRLSSEQVEAIKQEAGKFHGAVQVRPLAKRAGVNLRGFTLVELIMTMIIVGILAIVAVPRFTGNAVFQSRGFADQVQASLRYAQKTAIAQHHNVCVAMTSSDITLKIASASGAGSACDTNLVSPTTGQAPYKISTPSATITLAYSPSANFNFDALGATAAQQIITVSGATNNIVVEAETGYVHSP